MQYKCQYCERAFAQSNDLVKHTRSHVGMNTYKCDQCPVAFRLHGELRVHRQQHFLEQKGLLGDQSSQEGFDGKELEDQKIEENVNVDFQNMLRDTTKNDVRFDMLQLETSSQTQIFVSDKHPQQQQGTIDAHFMTHN